MLTNIDEEDEDDESEIDIMAFHAAGGLDVNEMEQTKKSGPGAT